MTAMRVISAAAATLILLGSAATAHAQQKRSSAIAPDAFTVRGDFDSKGSQFGPQAGKSLKWDANKGRWGLKLDVDPSRVRPTTDVEAGAYFKVTPTLRVGGAVGIGQPDQDNAMRKAREEPAPRVRLETALKF
ncbi:NtrZ family periplasmic regulatory protein [Caulobacter sp. NIBR2454]|uniref:NtrZ family periplasmic regulatory protein n=1 Tax=Caulobacter sp. NIBR2454 TaxID=3015996 RepID=UPI0022B70BD9|nr:hypothetical protein [Caulobacter sp. NIBR2454]